MAVVSEIGARIKENTACIIYREEKALSDEICPGCPVAYEKITELPVDTSFFKTTSQYIMNFEETIEPGFRYWYKVSLKVAERIPKQNEQEIEFEHP